MMEESQQAKFNKIMRKATYYRQNYRFKEAIAEYIVAKNYAEDVCDYISAGKAEIAIQNCKNEKCELDNFVRY